MKYQTVIGLEIHLVLNTRTKMFSSAPCSFESPANTCVNEIDMALPGTLPCLNKEAVRKALSLCLALDMDIDTLIRFDRKNYYYSDLPKGYQITQHFHPLGKNGKVMIDSSEGVKQIVIESLHLEEDTAKQFHRDDETLIDYNRCGLPLLEIVSAPQISSSEEAASYLSKLQQIFRYLDISNARMEEGEMRCDVNISLKETDASALGHKVEVKNLNSISNVKDAIDHETARQKEILEKGEEVAKETRRFDEKTKTTVMMRRKEDIVDYKYLREPNIFPIRITEEDLQEIRNTMPVLPETKYRTYIREYGLSEYTAGCLLKDRELSTYYDKAAAGCGNPKILANLLISDVAGLLSKEGMDIVSCPISPEKFSELADIIGRKELNSKQAKEVLKAMFTDGGSPKDIIIAKGYSRLNDEKAILAVIEEVLTEDLKAVDDYKKGRQKALSYLAGRIMTKTKGNADPEIVTRLLTNELAKR